MEEISKTITMSNGKQVKLQPVSPFLIDKVRGSVKFPVVPQYQATTVTGEVELYDHDENSLTTDEDKAAWSKYQDDFISANRQLQEKMQKMLFSRGVADVDTKGWQEEQEWLGIELPTKPMDLKYHYILTEVISSVADIAELYGEILILSGLDEGLVKQAEAAFRGDLQGPTDTPGQDS